MRILCVSRPGGDRGPAVGYKNHAKALNSEGFELRELTQKIWDDKNSFREFDVAWGYVRFHPQILDRCKDAGLPFIGGPNIAMERADVGISDEWERWYLEQSKVDVNINVADYYTNHVKTFSKNNCKFKTLEYCYELDLTDMMSSTKRDVDVTVYVKDRVNDGDITKISKEYCNLLEKEGIKYQVLSYGSYVRDDYLRACCRSKVTAWFSIEDYCSLAQIESHHAGSAVIGTPYNLTIPVDQSLLCLDSQDMTHNWIKWKDSVRSSSDYFKTTIKALGNKNLSKETIEHCKNKHSHVYYRQKVRDLIKSI